MTRTLAVLIMASAVSACTHGSSSRQGQAGRAFEVPTVIDGHNDLLIHYLDKSRGSFSSADSYDIGKTTKGQSDLPRMRAGRLGAAIFTTAIVDENDREAGIRQSTDLLRTIAARHPDDLEVVTDSPGILRAIQAGRIAVLMGLEGGDQIGGSLSMVKTLYQHGVRAMTLTWDKTNQLGDSASDSPKHDGLSQFGVAVVKEMNRLGMLIDLSHAAETTALDALATSRAPVIFSHSSAKALCPAPRNVSDAVLRRVAVNGGIVMISFVPYFTSAKHWSWYESGERHWESLKAAFPSDKAAASRAMKEWDRNNPPPVVTLRQVADHIEHVRRIAGIEHVGIGSDFDGMGSFRVQGLEDASTPPALLAELARRGWSDADLRKLASENFLRVFRRVETVAGHHGAETRRAVPADRLASLRSARPPAEPRRWAAKAGST